MIPFFGCAREFKELREAYHKQLNRSLEGGQFLQGHEVKELEDDLATLTKRLHGVVVGSCTDALFFALLSLGVGPGDEVLVPAFTFVATASSVLRVGASPVFVDVTENYQMDLKCAASQITKSTKAMIVVDLFGAIEDIYGINNFSSAYGLKVVEDAAQALGASQQGIPAGSIGDISCFSFDPTKPVCAPGSGGALVTDEWPVVRTVSRLRYHGKSDKRYIQLGYNSQMSTYAAALVQFKLVWYERPWFERRQEIACWYHDELKAPVQVPELDPEHAYSKYVIRVPNRDQVQKLLMGRGIPTRVHYEMPLHKHPLFSSHADCPVAEQLSQEVLSLPIHPFLTDSEVEQIVEGVKWTTA